MSQFRDPSYAGNVTRPMGDSDPTVGRAAGRNVARREVGLDRVAALNCAGFYAGTVERRLTLLRVSVGGGRRSTGLLIMIRFGSLTGHVPSSCSIDSGVQCWPKALRGAAGWVDPHWHIAPGGDGVARR